MPTDFEYDIFVSYAHTGDETAEITSDWSIKFSRFLDNLLNRVLHKKPTILLNSDLEIRKKMLNISSKEIFSKTAVFVTIISPDYVKSENYQNELQKIYDAVYTDDRNMVENTARIFKVVTSPVSIEEQPTCLQYEINYDFFEINPKTGKVKEFDISSHTAAGDKFWSKLVDLAYDISKSLSILESIEEVDVKTKTEKSIFLASTTPDQEENRDIIKRELQQLGFTVVPNLQLPEDAEKLKKVILKYLEKASLSVHIIGGYYGAYIKNSHYSLIDYQNRVIREFLQDKEQQNTSLHRVIWIPPDLRPVDERQVLYIERIKRDDAFENSEIIEAPIEELKSIVYNKLRVKREEFSRVEGKKSVYLIYKKGEDDKIKQIAHQLENSNLNVIAPNFDQAQFNVVEEHRKRLMESDAVLIYYGQENDQWLDVKIKDILKVPGYGRVDPFLVKGILVDSDTNGYARLLPGDFVIIRKDETQNCYEIEPFLSKLQHERPNK